MLTVKKFLFCLELETGGYFLGWCGIISSLFLGLAFLTSLAFSLQDIVDYINMRFAVTDKNQLPIMGEITFFECLVDSRGSYKNPQSALLILVASLIAKKIPVILIVFAVLVGCLLLKLYISILLIRGTENVSVILSEPNRD